MTSPFLDPNDPHYEDTPPVDEHPLEGGERESAVVAALHELDGTQHFITHEYDHDGDDMEGVECITGPDGHREDAAHLLDNLRADGYLLISEAELAEALRDKFPVSHPEAAAAIFAALAKQQEDRER